MALKNILFTYGLFFVVLSIKAQQNGLYPDQNTSYFNNFSSINPSHIPSNGMSEFLFETKRRTGIYQDISTITASIQKTIETKSNKTHAIRIFFFNEKEGPYISTPRFYGNYAIKIKLNKKLNLLGGASLGMVNPNYNTPTKTIEANLIDGSVGITLNYKNIYLGASSQQIFNSTSEHYSSLILKRHYNFSFSSSNYVNEKVDINTNFLFKYFSDIPSQAFGALSVVYSKSIEVGGGYQLKRGIHGFVSATIDSEGKHPIKLSFLYNSNLVNNAIALGDSFEITIKYFY